MSGMNKQYLNEAWVEEATEDLSEETTYKVNEVEEAKMVDIVVNCCIGGFGLSEKAKKLYCKKKNIEIDETSEYHYLHNSISRTDPILVEVVKELGSEADADSYTKLTIVSLPAGTKYHIAEYDGTEWIETPETIHWEIA
jgi:hypothetical protein